MRIHSSALKHGIAEADIRQAAEWPTWVDEWDEDDPSKQLRLGFDTSGRFLELAVLRFDDGEELVIHAMKARPKMTDLLF